MTATTQPLIQQCHDSFTLARHWVTAANVIFLFASAHIREPLERGTPLKKAAGRSYLLRAFPSLSATGQHTASYAALPFFSLTRSSL